MRSLPARCMHAFGVHIWGCRLVLGRVNIPRPRTLGGVGARDISLFLLYSILARTLVGVYIWYDSREFALPVAPLRVL